MSFLNLIEKEQFNKDLKHSLEAENSKDIEKVSILDLNCKVCGDKVLEIRRFQNKRYQHVILCGKCQWYLHRWGI